LLPAKYASFCHPPPVSQTFSHACIHRHKTAHKFRAAGSPRLRPIGLLDGFAEKNAQAEPNFATACPLCVDGRVPAANNWV
jgi:hypothetical protein